MSLASPVVYHPTIPARHARHPPTSPDSYRATPPSSSPTYFGAAQSLPYILAPDSRPSSPSSSARVDKLVKYIRDGEVIELHIACAQLRGPFGAGGSTWGVGGGRLPETNDDGDLDLPDNEAQAEELERRRLESKAANAAAAALPNVNRSPKKSPERRPRSSISIRTMTVPLLKLSSPQATSTPAIGRRAGSQATSSSQTRLGFTLSKPAVTRFSQPKDGLKAFSQPTAFTAPPQPVHRFAVSTAPGKPRSLRASLGSSQPTPYNSQFDVDRHARELSHLLEEDAFEVDRGVQQGAVLISDDDDD